MAVFNFKQFAVDDAGCAMKVGTDGVLLGAMALVSGATRVIDLGAGSGLLSLMVAQRAPETMVTAVEIDRDAVSAASANFSASPWAGRLMAVCADALTFKPEHAPGLIVCNPPFFTTGLLSPDSRRATARHGACGGLSPDTALETASRILAPEGVLAMVTPADIAADLEFHAEMLRLQVCGRCMVSTVRGKTPVRVIWHFSRKGSVHPISQPSSLAIRESSGEWTPEYSSLTRDFYLHL